LHIMCLTKCPNEIVYIYIYIEREREREREREFASHVVDIMSMRIGDKCYKYPRCGVDVPIYMLGECSSL